MAVLVAAAALWFFFLRGGSGEVATPPSPSTAAAAPQSPPPADSEPPAAASEAPTVNPSQPQVTEDATAPEGGPGDIALDDLIRQKVGKFAQNLRWTNNNLGFGLGVAPFGDVDIGAFYDKLPY